MNRPTLVKKTRVGIRRHPWRFIVSIFLSYSVLWAVIEPFLSFVVNKPPGLGLYLAMVGVSCVAGVSYAIPPRKIGIKIRNTDTSVRIYFADLLKMDGHKVVSVNEYFDSEIGDLVSPKSLHGVFIEKTLAGRSQLFERLVESALAKTQFETVARPRGKQKKYPIGTTAVVTLTDQRYFLVALSHTDISTLKACADVPQLWKALSGLWESVRNHSGGYPVNLPLIGSGLSGIGLPPRELLEIILLSFLNETKKKEIVKQLRIVITEDKFEEIDLQLIRKSWR